MNRSNEHKNNFEANFSILNDEYFISVWDQNKNNNFQEFGLDALTIKHKKNNLFISNFLCDTCSLIINSKAYLFKGINDSLILLSPIAKDSLHTPVSWMLNDTFQILSYINSIMTALTHFTILLKKQIQIQSLFMFGKQVVHHV